MKPITLVAVVLAVAGLASPAPLWAGRDISCVKLEVSSAAESHGVAADRFSARATVDLTLTVLFRPDAAGDHLLEIDLFTPDGQLYRSLEVPITAADRSAGWRKVAGYPRPMKERKLQRVLRGNSAFLAVSVAFPVGGTDIVANGLYGRWKVDARLDGLRSPCLKAATFTMTE